MKPIVACLAAVVCALPLSSLAEPKAPTSITVPFALDHNRMLVEAEVRAADGSWKPARLWVDTGNPAAMLDEAFARRLGLDVAAQGGSSGGQVRSVGVPPLAGVRIGGMAVDFSGVETSVLVGAPYLGAMHADANLPSTVLRRYQVVFDYPVRRLTLAAPGRYPPRGTKAPAAVNAATGIVQLDAAVGGEALSFALDNGASYSFTSPEVLDRLGKAHPGWPRGAGAVGCANIWGTWPQEASWPLLRVPEIIWGGVRLPDVGLVGLPSFFPDGTSVGAWYSRKTARPVDGFLGPNAFRAFRVEIDYAGGAVYFEKGAEPDPHDLDLVGVTVGPEAGGRWKVVGVAQRDGRPVVEGVEAGDLLLGVGSLQTTGATMGTVVDALRGTPGDSRVLTLERAGKRITVESRVRRLL